MTRLVKVYYRSSRSSTAITPQLHRWATAALQRGLRQDARDKGVVLLDVRIATDWDMASATTTLYAYSPGVYVGRRRCRSTHLQHTLRKLYAASLSQVSIKL